MRHLKEIVLFTLLSFCIFNFALSGTPDWVKNFGVSAKYPDRIYIVGFGVSSEKDPAKGREDAINKAIADISRRIKVTISSKTSTAVEESNQKFAEYVNTVTQSSTSLHLEGIETETYNDDGTFYALAYMQREALVEHYHAKVQKLKEDVRAVIDQAQALEANGDKSSAIEKYSAAFPLLAELHEAISILIVADAGSFAEIDTVSISPEKVTGAIDRIINRPVRSVDDAAWFVGYMLGQQQKGGNALARVVPLTYQDTKMSSQFGRYMQQLLEQRLASVAKWPVGGPSGEAQWLVSGTYWLHGDQVKLFVQVRELNSGNMVANTEVTFPKSVIDTAISLTPQNFVQALSDQKVFNKDEVVNGGLQVEVWTDRGNDGVVYTKDDTMHVYVRVNRESYVRLVYHMADGRRELLEDSYYISSNLVNQVVPIPERWICSEPYGAEVLQAFARTVPFEPIETQDVDGFKILKEDLEKFVVRTRGMKTVKDTAAQQAEARVVVTTMER
jgi:hypothetical protein